MTVARSLTVDGVTLQLALRRKGVKNVNARLNGQCLTVSAPPHLDDEHLWPLIEALARRLLRRRRACEVNGEPAAEDIARRVAAAFPLPPKVTRIEFVTTQTHRWGSYSARTGVVRLNAALLAMPRWVLEAVVAHELAHSFHPNHGRDFHALLHRVCPTTDRANAFLAGVSWVARRWPSLPPVERALLAGVQRCDDLGGTNRPDAGSAKEGGEG